MGRGTDVHTDVAAGAKIQMPPRGKSPTKRKYAEYSKPSRQMPFRPGIDRISGNYKRFGSKPGSDGELKYFDIEGDDSNVNTGGWHIAESTLNNIPKGDGPNERIGRRIRIVAIQYRINAGGVLNNQTPATLDADDLRVRGGFAFVLDKQANQSASTAASDVVTTITNPTTFNNMTNTQRFHTYKKEIWPFDVTAMTQGTDVSQYIYLAYSNKFFEGHISVDIPITFDNTAGAITVANVMSNNLIFMTFGEAPAWQKEYTIRVRYKDE